ncbi:hypothetical protein CGMCC3_g6578 [Colletotrichum fructicola]|nr:uncharacterized protein CGMCC3_g6578 [Colletotrichum fructicola]KAE9577562.1 hypothetical protein CGMCC3_g6578 [Colletotrichum fructicola]
MQLRYHVLEASFSPGFIAPNVPPMIVAVGLMQHRRIPGTGVFPLFPSCDEMNVTILDFQRRGNATFPPPTAKVKQVVENFFTQK